MQRTIYTPEHQRLVALLRQAREGAGITQAELAQRLDVPQSFVSKYESGQRRLDLVELQQICVALGADLVKLVRAYAKVA